MLQTFKKFELLQIGIKQKIGLHKSIVLALGMVLAI